MIAPSVRKVTDLKKFRCYCGRFAVRRIYLEGGRLSEPNELIGLLREWPVQIISRRDPISCSFARARMAGLM
jgi:hypothetical protein